MSLHIERSLVVGPEAVAIITGTFLSGTLMSLYSITMPVLVQTQKSTPLLLQQWAQIFYRGHVQGPALAIVTGTIYIYAAWAQAVSGGSWKPYAAASAFNFGIVPYTWIFMNRINTALFDAEAVTSNGKTAVEKERVNKMIVTWTRLHGVRSLLPLAGAVTGLLAMLRFI
ncbi:Noranthrone monooxygenase [Ascochyta lentis]